jgi:biotin operon repressor
MATKHEVLAKLARHIGQGNGIRGEDLARDLGIPSREVRKHITELVNVDGIGICGYPATGYFIASNEEELKNTIKFHTDRALHELKKASSLSGLPLEELMGQMCLET